MMVITEMVIIVISQWFVGSFFRQSVSRFVRGINRGSVGISCVVVVVAAVDVIAVEQTWNEQVIRNGLGDQALRND